MTSSFGAHPALAGDSNRQVAKSAKDAKECRVRVAFENVARLKDNMKQLEHFSLNRSVRAPYRT